MSAIRSRPVHPALSAKTGSRIAVQLRICSADLSACESAVAAFASDRTRAGESRELRLESPIDFLLSIICHQA